MIEILMLLALNPANAPVTAQIQPCVWPKCERTPVVAQIQPCVWPKCSKEETLL